MVPSSLELSLLIPVGLCPASFTTELHIFVPLLKTSQKNSKVAQCSLLSLDTLSCSLLRTTGVSLLFSSLPCRPVLDARRAATCQAGLREHLLSCVSVSSNHNYIDTHRLGPNLKIRSVPVTYIEPHDILGLTTLTYQLLN